MELHAKTSQRIEQSNLEDKILDPLGDGMSSLELLRVSGSDLEIANAARVSYGKLSSTFTDRDKILINFLLEHEHTSPFEHNQLSFRVKCPIFVARQWMRHRMSSYNEISYRYVKSALEFYIPKNWRYQHAVNRQCSEGEFYDQEALELYKASLASAVQAYECLLEKGVAREIARGVLPVCTYTSFIYTVNLHSLMHFLKLRLPSDAQPEIRSYAQGLLELAMPHFPVSLDAWTKKHKLL